MLVYMFGPADCLQTDRIAINLKLRDLGVTEYEYWEMIVH